MTDLDTRCQRLIDDLGLDGALRSVTPLGGGVASDIAVLDLEERRICAKFALAKLKVMEDWFAPVHRNRAEYEWLRFAGTVVTGAVPGLHGWSAAENGFAMDFVEGREVYLWKEAMLRGEPVRGEAARVGDVLGRIHAASTASGFDDGPFHNRDDFHALRLEPYLIFTATQHPDLAERLNRLAKALFENRAVLIHGDVSPKNILMRGGDPVLLDAECATMGDPAFDVAFCLNHLILKSIHIPTRRNDLLEAIGGFWRAYAAQVVWEEASALEVRVCALLPALMLARVDGKSPVEYLSAVNRGAVRDLSRTLVTEPPTTLADMIGVLR